MKQPKTPKLKCSFKNCKRKPEFVSEETLSPQCCIGHMKLALKKWNVTAFIPIEVWNTKVCPATPHATHIGCRQGTPPIVPYLSGVSYAMPGPWNNPYLTERERAVERQYRLLHEEQMRQEVAARVQQQEQALNQLLQQSPTPFIGGAPKQESVELRKNPPFDNALVDKMFGF